jgi:hypothetical protein
MAIAAADFTITDTIPLGKGRRMVWGRYTPSGTYTSGGEGLTTAIANAKIGLSTIAYMNFTPLVTAAGTSYATLVYDHTASAGILGKIHFTGNGAGAHVHDILIKGGQTAQTHTHDILAIGGLVSSEPLLLDAAQSFGKAAATNRTVVGSTSATTGGVVVGSTATAISMISTDTLGKEQATDRTIAGSASATKGGIVTSTSNAVGAELAAGTDLSTYSCSFVCYGQRTVSS